MGFEIDKAPSCTISFNPHHNTERQKSFNSILPVRKLMLREVKSLPQIAPGLLSGSPHLFSSTQVARFSGEESDQIIPKVPFSIIIPPFYEATAQKFATNPGRLPRRGEFRTRCEKEREASLVEESSVLCVSIRGEPNTYHPSFPPCSKKTKGKKANGGRWELEMPPLLLIKANLVDLAD